MNRWLLVFLLVLTGARLFWGGRMELSPDEAYSYQWSQRLDWAYYSGGPGVALAIRAGTALLGASELGVRLLSPFLALGTCLFVFGLARRMYGESVATWAVLLLNFTPIFNANALLMTPDALSIFFWAAAMWAFWRALERTPEFSAFWPLAGLFLGLGFLSKYASALGLLSVALVLLLTVKYWREFARPGLWVMLGVFLLSLIPLALWNAQHDGLALDLLRSRGAPGLHPEELPVFLALHIGVYSPLIFAGMLWALGRGFREMPGDFRTRFLTLFALPTLGVYGVLSIKRPGEAQWTAPAFLSLGILAVAYGHELAQGNAKARRFAVAALGLGIAVSLVLLNTDAARQLGIRWPYKHDPCARMRGWESAALAVNDLRHKMEQETGRPVFLIANGCQTASSLAFYLPEKRADGPGHPPVYIPESQAIENQYSFWGRYDEMTEPPEIARAMAPKVADVAKREALEVALKAVGSPGAAKGDPEKMAERRRGLIRALLAIDPTLPLEEYASEDWGISLFQGRDALYISDRSDQPPTAIQNGFEKVEMVAALQEERRGLPLRWLWVFACHKYRSIPL